MCGVCGVNLRGRLVTYFPQHIFTSLAEYNLYKNAVVLVGRLAARPPLSQADSRRSAAKESATRERLLAKLVKGAVAALLRRVRVDANARARAFEVWRARLELWLPARARAPVRCAGRRLDAQAQADGQGRAPAARGGAHCAKADREAPACGGAGGRACGAGPEGEARHGHTEAQCGPRGESARRERGEEFNI